MEAQEDRRRLIAEQELLAAQRVVQKSRESHPSDGNYFGFYFASSDDPSLGVLRSAVESARANDVEASIVEGARSVAEAAAMEAKLGKELEKWMTVPMADKTMLPGMAELKEIIEQAELTACSAKMLEGATKQHRRLEVETEYLDCLQFKAIEVRAACAALRSPAIRRCMYCAVLALTSQVASSGS